MLQFDDRLKKIQKRYEKQKEQTKKGGRLMYHRELIAKSSDSQDVAGIFHVLIDLAAQPADMHINRAIGNECLIAPYVIKNLIAGINTAGMAGKKEKKFKFRGT